MSHSSSHGQQHHQQQQQARQLIEPGADVEYVPFLTPVVSDNDEDLAYANSTTTTTTTDDMDPMAVAAANGGNRSTTSSGYTAAAAAAAAAEQDLSAFSSSSLSNNALPGDAATVDGKLLVEQQISQQRVLQQQLRSSVLAAEGDGDKYRPGKSPFGIMDLRMHFALEIDGDNSEFWGYEPSSKKILLYYIFGLLSLGTLFLWCYWWPRHKMRLTCEPKPLRTAPLILSKAVDGTEKIHTVNAVELTSYEASLLPMQYSHLRVCLLICFYNTFLHIIST